MDVRPITGKQKVVYNKLATHIIQSWQWGEFRQSLGIPTLRYGIYEKGKPAAVFQLTLHQIPLTDQYVGYLPKGPYPDQTLADALKKIGQDQHCAFIKIEPDVILEGAQRPIESIKKDAILRHNVGVQHDKVEIANDFIPSPKPLFTKYNFIVDLTKSEEELLKNMHPKTRYNIKVAIKHRVRMEERTDDKAFEIYLQLYFATTKRQKYLGHNENYHRLLWKKLRSHKMARLLIAFYQNKPITCWMLLNFKDSLYYPYGGSAKTHPEVMASNLVAWQAIKLGKKMGLKKFDMWGALGPAADPQDPWYGFHRFKQGYGGQLVECLGTYDLVFNWPVYWMFTAIDRFTPLKVFLLKLLRK